MITLKRKIDLNHVVVVESLSGLTFTNESGGHRFEISGEKDGETVSFSGSVSARFLRSDGSAVLLGSGGQDGRENYASIVNGKVEVTLHADCYNVPGRFMLSVFVTDSTSTTCVYAAVGTVVASDNEILIDSGEVVPTIDELLARIEECVSVTNDAKVAVATVDNLYCMKEDILGDYGDIIVPDPDSETFKRYGDESSGKRWSFDTNGEYGSGGRFYYAIYTIPTGTKIIGVSAWHYSDAMAAFGFYNGDPKNGGTQIFHITGLPAGAIKCATYVPNNATHLLVQLGSSTTRGVYPFTSKRDFVDQAVHMFGMTINNFNALKAVLPHPSEEGKASFDEAVNGTIYYIGFIPGAVSEYPNIVGMPARISGALVTLSAYDSYNVGAIQIYFATTGIIYIRVKSSYTWRPWVEHLTKDGISEMCEPKEKVYYVGGGRIPSEYEDSSFVDLLMRDGFKENTEPKVIYIEQGTYDIYGDYLKYASLKAAKDRSRTDGFADYNVVIPANTRVVGIGDVVFNFFLDPTDSTTFTTPTEAYNASRLWSCLNLVYGGTTVENITLHCKNCRYGIHDESDNVYNSFTNRYKRVNIIMEDANTVRIDGEDKRLGFGPAIGFGFEDAATYIFEGCHFTDYYGGGYVSAFYGHDGSAVGGTKVIATDCIFETFDGNGNPVTANRACARLQSLRDWDDSTSRACVAHFSNCYMSGGIRLQSRDGENHGGMWDAVLLNCGNPAQEIDTAKRTGTISVYNT